MKNMNLEVTAGPMAQKHAVGITNVPIASIVLGKNSRSTVTDEDMAALMQSIKEVGLLQPIGVIPKGKGKWEVCYGNRRFLAAKKLGWKEITAVIQPGTDRIEVDLQNLTENMQRKPLTLQESGRYVTLLRKDGLTFPEIATRLALTLHQVKDFAEAYQAVPQEYRNKVAFKTKTDKRKKNGTIALNVAAKLSRIIRKERLSKAQEKFLYEAARSDDRFQTHDIHKYAAAAASGAKDPIGDIEVTSYIGLNFRLTKKEKEQLEATWVKPGGYRSLSDLAKAVLRGKENVRFNII